MLMSNAMPALRVSNAIAITLLFIAGYAYGRITGRRPGLIGIAMVVLGLSYYLRTKIGYQRWKAIHGFTVLAWIGGLVHTFTEGSDAGQLWFIALILLTAAPAFVLLAMRLSARRSRRPQPTPALGESG